jgi:hypothetical protein
LCSIEQHHIRYWVCQRISLTVGISLGFQYHGYPRRGITVGMGCLCGDMKCALCFTYETSIFFRLETVITIQRCNLTAIYGIVEGAMIRQTGGWWTYSADANSTLVQALTVVRWHHPRPRSTLACDRSRGLAGIPQAPHSQNILDPLLCWPH